MRKRLITSSEAAIGTDITDTLIMYYDCNMLDSLTEDKLYNFIKKKHPKVSEDVIREQCKYYLNNKEEIINNVENDIAEEQKRLAKINDEVMQLIHQYRLLIIDIISNHIEQQIPKNITKSYISKQIINAQRDIIKLLQLSDVDYVSAFNLLYKQQFINNEEIIENLFSKYKSDIKIIGAEDFCNLDLNETVQVRNNQEVRGVGGKREGVFVIINDTYMEDTSGTKGHQELTEEYNRDNHTDYQRVYGITIENDIDSLEYEPEKLPNVQLEKYTCGYIFSNHQVAVIDAKLLTISSYSVSQVKTILQKHGFKYILLLDENNDNLVKRIARYRRLGEVKWQPKVF